MSNLTKKYIEDHMNNIQSYDSFGRNLVQMILEQAAYQAGEKSIEKAKVPLEFEVAAFEPKACITIGIGRATIHIAL